MDSSDDDEPPILVDLAAQQGPIAPNEIKWNNNKSTSQQEATHAAGASISHYNEASLKPCPVTILSGFLGSGKTTLIQYILKDPNHGKRIAVIENEFGDGLAVETMIARDGVDPSNGSLQDLIELPNGCICCTVKDSLVATLETLVAKRKDLDYILIEASGMANPGPIASVFWLDEALESRLQLDGIVTVVDANHILEQLAHTEEAAQQIAYADRLLINKVDTLPQKSHGSVAGGDNNHLEALEKITATLRRLHPTAPMMTTTYSQVPNLDWILNANCFGGAARMQELDTLWNNAKANETAEVADQHGGDGGHKHSEDHDHGDCQVCATQHPFEGQHRHTDAVTTVAFQQAGSISLTRLNAWLAEILWPHQDESNEVLTSLLHDSSKKKEFTKHQKRVMQIFRIKGVVSVVHDDSERHLLDSHEIEKYTTPIRIESSDTEKFWLDRRRYIIQAVHDLWEVHPGSDNLQFEVGEHRVGKLVVIGKNLPKHRLEHGFQACFVDTGKNS